MRFLKVSLAILIVLAMTLTLISCTPTSTEPTTYTVTFDLNYEGAPEAQKFTVKSGERATKPTDPTRTNYEFKGWFVDKECLIEQTFLSSGVTQSPINKITADTTFYAKWEPITAKAKLVSITATYVGGDVEIGQPLNTSLISVAATYDDDTTKKVTGFEVSKLDSSEAGQKTVTVTYTEDGVTVTCDLKIQVVEEGEVVEPTGTTLYFKTESAWDEVYIYTYTPELNGVWPGELMTPVEDNEGWYSYTFEEGVEPTNVIFNNNDTAQTGNLTYDGTNNYYAYNPVINAGQWGSDFTVTAPTEAKTVKLFYYNADNWATVNAYVWAGSTNYTGEWPGTAMTADTENVGWFFIEVNENATNVIFNDGGENQTKDLTIVATTLYYYDGTWYETMPHIHTYSGDCDATCNECGETRETTVDHTYDNACDTDCNVCGEVRQITHDYVQMHDETNHWEQCSVCEDIKADSTQAHSFELNHNSTHHWNECSVCGYIDETSREEHSYTDGKCECGADEPAEPVVLESIKATVTTEGILFVNTELTASDFEVIKVMSNSEEQPVTDTENISVALKDGSTNATEGQAIYVITYGGKTTEVTVTFTKKLTGITAVATETTVEYGGNLVLTVTASYDGAESQEVTEFTTDFVNTTVGLQTVTVTYAENGITVTTTVEITVNDLPKTTYYFYNKDGWESVYAYAWMEESIPVILQAGDFVIMGDILGEENQWTTEGSVKLFFNQTENQYSFEGLKLTAGMKFKIAQLGETEHTYYGAVEQWVDASLYTIDDDGNIVIAQDGIYNFYFKNGSKELYFGKGTNESTPNVEVKSTTLTAVWPGNLMTAVEGHEGWFSIEIDARVQKLIFTDNAGNQTPNLTPSADKPYYNDGWIETMHTHTYSGDCDATCNECGETRETTAEHTYDNACDTDCNVCGEVRETTHNYETKHDETYHWTECSECGATTEKVAHAWDEGTVTTEPTCTTAGVKTFTCECGATKTEEIPMLAHSYGEEWLSNETGHWHACQCGATTEVEAHVPNIEQPTEEESQVCTVCGYVIAPAISHTHTPDTEWTSDETYHWHACNGCDEQLDKAEHLFNQEVATEEYLATSATCTAKATYYYSCECGAKGAETFENGETIAHQYVVDHDDAQHWNKCSVCGYIDETSREDHLYVEGSCTCGAEEPAQQTTTTYYFYNFAKWTEVSAYTWADPATEGEAATEFNGAFPGQTMTEWEGHPGWYYIEVDSNAQNIIFNGMSGETRMQTNTLQLGEDVYHAILGWSSQPSVENIVVLDTTGGSWGEADAVLKLYYWNDGGDGWIDFQAVAGTGTANKYFALSIADCEIAGFKLVRKATGVTENGWNDVWNETNDLTVDAGLYVSIPSDNWNWGMQSAV